MEIVNIMDNVESITFDAIYAKFIQTEQYQEVGKEFNSNDQHVKESMKRLLVHFMTKQSGILAPNQYHKLRNNIPLEIGRKYNKMKQKYIIPFNQ